jgi:MYXO-CTERM domain-containing protein
MRLSARTQAALAAAALMTLLPAAANAQDNSLGTGTTTDTTYATPVEREDDDDFPWGLLGLLGLAGLAGLKRKERDIHVDNRRP